MLAFTQPHVLQGKVSYYCLSRQNGNGTTPTTCSEPTQGEIDTFVSSMATCFKDVVNAGLDIAISPHLDDGLGYGDHLSLSNTN